MQQSERVLVAIINCQKDLKIARELHWYRIPVESVERFLKKGWAPDWIAFYQTRVFTDEAYTIQYYARVLQILKVYRWQLFPNEPPGEKTQRQYYKLELTPLNQLECPIQSDRRRRISFISTTFEKFKNAVEIRDF